MRYWAVLRTGPQGPWWLFREPIQVVWTDDVSQVIPLLGWVEHQVASRGLYAVGWVAYEAAPAMDPALHVHPPGGMPLLWFGLYSAPVVLDPTRVLAAGHLPSLTWTPRLSREEYTARVRRIKAYIAAGDTYQVNYTFPMRAAYRASAWELFAHLVRAQDPPYGAYIDAGRFVVCSASPELFFALQGDQLISRPMKGTAGRGRTWKEDQAQAERLRTSEKERAENVMIVDMVRNDMGRIARVGSVRVPQLFTVERYPTVWQMTSTVEARTEASVVEIFRHLFPPASVTGAPKVRTMSIIAQLEVEPRGVYTGAIGYLAPGRRAQFNVAIRTVIIDREPGTAVYSVGSGVVWDSEPEREYQECLTKARVLTTSCPEFDLLESVLWEPERGYFLLDAHLERMAHSAAYFGFPWQGSAVRRLLMRLSSRWPPKPHKVRVLLARDGHIQVTAHPLEGRPRPLRVGVARTPVNSEDPFLYHKTTYRAPYKEARNACPECDDVLLWNERGEVTESTVANVIARLDGEWITPPVESGLLPGVFRAWLLRQGLVKERPLKLTDLPRVEALYLVNSVRKWMPVQVLDLSHGNWSGGTAVRNGREDTSPAAR